VANNTNVSLHSSWPSPKFEGQFLPDTSTVDKNGFNAKWTILDINRQITQQWAGNDGLQQLPAVSPGRYNDSYAADGTNNIRSVLGVELLDTVDHYTKNDRTVKYAFLLITLTFVIYFFCEVLKKQKVHPLQYGLVGCGTFSFNLVSLQSYRFYPAYFAASWQLFY
jgi:inner membrane protein